MSVIFGTVAADLLTGSAGADEIYGFDGADSLSGLAGKDTIYGGPGSDTIHGDSEDDALDGGTGVDSLIGNGGDDAYFVDDSADVIVEASGEGYDTVYAQANTVLSANLEQLIVYGAATAGTGNSGDNNIFGDNSANSLTLDGAGGDDWIIGSDQADTLIGGSGNDILEGHAGANRMEGGIGEDVYFSTSATDIIVEAASGGFDTVYTNVDIASLAANVEQVILLGAATSITGNSGDNDIFGIYSANSLVIDGAGGNDVVVGSSQSDTLKGGSGNDSLEGLGGNNRLEGGSGDDVMYSTSSGDTIIENAGDGFDTLYANYSVSALAANVEQLVVYGAATVGNGNSGNNNIFGSSSANSLNLDGGAGNDLIIASNQSDTILGGDGNDTIEGLGGSNSMTGGAGDDTYYSTSSGDVVSEDSLGGFDTMYSNHSVTALAANVEQLVVYGAALIGNGNSGDNNIFGSTSGNSLNLDGAGGDDWVVGSNQADTIAGGDGHDLLFGLDGADSIIGGEGEDDLIGGAGADSLDGGLGTNRAWYLNSAAGVDVSLATGDGHGGEAEGDKLVNIANLVGSQQGDTLAGNDSDNTFFGLGGSDQLNGGAGADSLLGGDGADALNGDGGSDALFGESGDDELTTVLAAGDTDFIFGGEGGERAGDTAVVEGNAAINTYLVGGNGLGFVYVGSGAESGESAANTFITDTETIQLVTSSTSDDVEIADGIAAAGTNAVLVDVAEGDDTVTVTASSDTGLGLLQVSLGDGDDSFDFSNLDAATVVLADGGAGDDSFQLHAGTASVFFDCTGSGGVFGDDAVSGLDADDLLIFTKGGANIFNVVETMVNGTHLLTAEADGVTVGTVSVSGTFDFAANVVIQ